MSKDTLGLGRGSRRHFLREGMMLTALGACERFRAEAPGGAPIAKIGLVTDLHYADKAPAGTRYYRQSVGKLREAGLMFERAKVSRVVELGDFVDAADSVSEALRYLERIQSEFSRLPGKKHYVLGNHCVDTLTKAEFLSGVGMEDSFLSFDESGFHFVILDACFRNDGEPYGRRNFQWTDPNIPPSQVEWLEADLRSTSKPTIVFVHQRLDVGEPYGVKNAKAINRLLQASGQVIAVFQGHSHENDYRCLQGIHYVTLVAMVEGQGPARNGYAVMNLYEGGRIAITGGGEQKNYSWA